MKQIQRGIFCAGCFWVIVLVMAFFIHSACNFHSCLKGDYSTPWFDKSWVKDPYTNFRLLFGQTAYRVTTNGAGDIWVVKQVTYHGKEFWTVDYKIDREQIYEKKQNH